MSNIGKIAKKFEKKILENSNTEFVKTLLPKNDAERLAYDYLPNYNLRLEAINPHIPELSSYVVAAAGVVQNA